MVLEGKITELLQNQASRFLRGFSADQLRLGLLSGRLELQRLALNSEPIDELLRELESPLCVKAGVLTSGVIQVSLLQGEVELIIDGLTLVLAPCCRWFNREEVRVHRANEMQKLEFVHMRSQSQRRNLEHEMFRKLFSDYLSRVKLTVRNIHIRVEIDGKLDAVEPSCTPKNLAVGLLLGSCEIVPSKALCVPTADRSKSAGVPQAMPSNEVLLSEKAEIKDFSLYHEAPTKARLLIPIATYHSTVNHALGVFSQIRQEDFLSSMQERWQYHATANESDQLVPPLSLSVEINLKAQPLRIGSNVDSCLTMQIHIRLPGAPSQFHVTSDMLEHARWYVNRSSDFNMWQYLHLSTAKPRSAHGRWAVVRAAQALKRRIYRDRYTLREALTMRVHCKEYIRLYKKKFNGPESIVPWRQGMPTLTDGELKKLTDIELTYPADKIVNFRLMAHAELRTEMALNKVHCIGQGGNNSPESAVWQGINGSPFRQEARELTQLERLHLHGQHGYGINIYRGVPPPPSSIKIHLDFEAPHGIWWVCRNGDAAKNTWAVALDCTAQPLKAALSDNVVDASVFATIEVANAPAGQRPLALLLARSAAAFEAGSPGRNPGASLRLGGGSGLQEWCAVMEFDGAVYCCSQFRTIMSASVGTPWDIFLHLSCGEELHRSVADVGDVQLDAIHGYQYPRPAQDTGASVHVDEDARLYLRIPGFLATGQFGGIGGLTGYACNTGVPNVQPESAIAWIARCISVSKEIALLRLHFRLPPLVVESIAEGSRQQMSLPRFDAACHLEHGGLLDGFIVGLHSLRHFFACLMAATGPSINEQPSGFRTALSLEPLVRTMPPVMTIASALTAALGLALTSRKHGSDSSDATLLALMKKHNLLGVLQSKTRPVFLSRESPLASLSLILVLMATVSGRRVMWDCSNDVATATPKVGDLHGIFGTALRALLLFGVPLHPQCLSLAAWSGSCELLEAVRASLPSGVSWPPRGLLTWAVRGAYVNLEPRQEAVVRWLIQQRAKIDERDREGWSLLEWACWAGAESLATMALRAGMLPAISCMPEPPSLEPSDVTTVAASHWPPSPLTLAVASRSRGLVASLLRAACDPHLSTNSGHGGPLLLAVQKGEYELGCQLLKSAPFVAVDSALSNSGEYTSCGVDDDDENSLTTGDNVQATIVLMDSFKRFARAISPRGTEDAPMNTMIHSGLRTTSFGSHPDEGLYSSGKAPFSGVLHPLLMELPRPKHRVGYESRPQTAPHWSMMRCTSTPWYSAHQFIELCLQHGFRPDGGVMTQALPSLPSDAKRVVQKLLISTTQDPNNGLDIQKPFDTVRALRHFKLLDLDSPGKTSPRVSERCLAKSPILGGRAGTVDIDDGILPERVAEALTVCLETYNPLPEYGEVTEVDLDGNTEPRARDNLHDTCWAPEGLLATPDPDAASLPLVRVVVLGAPRTGKTTVSNCLLANLDMHEPQSETALSVNSGTACLTVHSGVWPPRQRPNLMVTVWDGCAAQLPGLLTRLADPAAAVLFVWVVDAELGTPPKEDLIQACMVAANPFRVPRRAMVVFNEFTNPSRTPAGTAKGLSDLCPVVRGCMKTDEGPHITQFRQVFTEFCEEILGDLSSRPDAQECVGSLTGAQPRDGSSTARQVSLPMPRQVSASDPVVRNIREMGWRFRGDASLSDPSAVSWAWAAVNSSMGFLTEGAALSFVDATRPSRCDGSVVLMDRLLRVLDAVSSAQNTSLTAPMLVRALSDLGLVCPIPHAVAISAEQQNFHLGCTWALIPDFARRGHLTSDQVRNLAGSNSKEDNSGSKCCLAARILWDAPGGPSVPSPRSVLRDFLGRGALACGGAVAGHSYNIEVVQFTRLESGPTGIASELESDDCAPGFLLTFDLTAANSKDRVPSEGRVSNIFAKPPSSVKALSPSGDVNAALVSANQSAATDQRKDLTTLILGTSGRVMTHTRGTPFWDLYCHGPHAQWAMRAFFGSGACGPSFTNFQCSGKFDLRSAKSDTSSTATWKMPAPTCVLSCKAVLKDQPEPVKSLTDYESFGLSWLFNGADGSSARAGILQGSSDCSPNPFAACCAALCGKSAAPASRDGLDFHDGIYGLGVCADFHAALLARNWRIMAEVLQECLDAGVEMWTMCHAALVRLSHDLAGTVAGSRGRALPLLCIADSSTSSPNNSSCRKVTLVPDGPLPIMASSRFAQPKLQDRSTTLNSGPGVEAWLCICRPAALWSAAAGACTSADSLAFGTASGMCAPLVEAIQVALQTRMTEDHVSEVWGAVDKLIERNTLMRRANGTWALVPDNGSFLL